MAAAQNTVIALAPQILLRLLPDYSSNESNLRGLPDERMAHPFQPGY
jgi:hypothetical protein